MEAKKLILFMTLALFFYPACDTEVVIENGDVTINELNLPNDCRTVLLDVKFEQGSKSDSRTAKATPAGVDKMEKVGEEAKINFANTVKITITVRGVHGSCPPLEIGQEWIFEGKLTKEAEKKYSVKFKEFKKKR